MEAPSATVVATYLGDAAAPYDEDQVTSALAAEATAQAKACRIPTDDEGEPDYPPDLAEALCRRVAANLANRNLPLGVQIQVAEFGGASARVGGLDREVRRLEGPYRKVICG